MRFQTALWSLFAALSALSAAAQNRTENLILITVDGVRTQEMFRGLDLQLVRAQSKDRPVEESPLYKKYWADTPEARRAKLMPFFWNVLMREHGSIAGNQELGSSALLRNQRRFSYPGYSELLTGAARDEVITSNAKKQNPFPTVLDFFQERLDLGANGVAAFGSWTVIEAIVSHRADSFLANAGFEPYSGGSRRIRALSQLQMETATPWDSVRHDAYTFRFAMSFLREFSPRVLYLSLGETDDWAHDHRYDRVLHALELTDQYLRQLWTFLQSEPQYREKTTIILTTDHGRGKTPDDWGSHGADVEGAQDIWVAWISPDIDRRGEWKKAETIHLDQVAATAAELMGLDYRETHPDSGQPIDF